MQQVGSVEHITAAGDTFDALALSIYNEERKAALLIRANPRYSDVLIFAAGTKLSVPLYDDVADSGDVAPWRS
jgi:hypothetical protein